MIITGAKVQSENETKGERKVKKIKKKRQKKVKNKNEKKGKASNKSEREESERKYKISKRWSSEMPSAKKIESRILKVKVWWIKVKVNWRRSSRVERWQVKRKVRAKWNQSERKVKEKWKKSETKWKKKKKKVKVLGI